MAQLQSDLSEFVGLLNSHGVEYLIVGGYAVAFHGHPRLTGDIDIFVRTSRDNSRRILKVLDDFGFTEHGLSASHLTSPGRIVQLGNPPNRVDLLTSITGVAFDEAWSGRVPGRLGEHVVDYIGLEALLKNKAASGRPTDLADVAVLRSVNDVP